MGQAHYDTLRIPTSIGFFNFYVFPHLYTEDWYSKCQSWKLLLIFLTWSYGDETPVAGNPFQCAQGWQWIYLNYMGGVCSVSTCRGQYIVYHPDALNVRPNCHYRRTQSESAPPLLECTKCLNRVIYPQNYRPSTFAESKFLCTVCASHRETILEIETSAEQISSENTTNWLAVDVDFPSKSPFDMGSVNHTITTMVRRTSCSESNYFQLNTVPSCFARRSSTILKSL